MRSLMSFLERAIENFSLLLVRIGMGGILVMMALVVVDVCMRTFAARSLLLTEEVSGYLLVLVAYFSFAEALKQDRHVRVDLLVSFLPARVQARLDLILSCIAAAAMTVVFWRTVVMVHNSYERGVKIPGILLTPVFLPQTLMAFGLLALLLQFIVEIKKMARMSGRPIEREKSATEKEEVRP